MAAAIRILYLVVGILLSAIAVRLWYHDVFNAVAFSVLQTVLCLVLVKMEYENHA